MKGALWLSALAVLVGCATTGNGPVIAPAVDIFHESADGRMARYDVSPSGRIRFAGGFAARDRQWSWTGHITPEQGAALTRVIDENHLMQWHSTGLATGDVWTVTIRQNGTRNSFTSTGSPDGVKALWSIVEDAGRQRLKADLDRLPKPDIDGLLERRQRESTQGSAP